MEQLSVWYLEQSEGLPPDHVFLRLDSLEKHKIEQVPWLSYPYQPEVAFVIAYNEENIFLKYFVKERHIRAKTKNINGQVWEDSCVEFFISFDDRGYYNLEFNCEGTALAGFGKDRYQRDLMPADVVNKLRTESYIQRQESELIHWELSVMIPLDVFLFHNLSPVKNRKCRANFYKCGDLLPEPHFLSWSEISSAEPDFHLPQFFGTLHFT